MSRSVESREKKSFWLKQFFYYSHLTRSSLFPLSSFASLLSTSREREYVYICEDSCHYICIYTYVCTNDSTYTNTNIQTFTIIGTHTHKQKPFNTTNTKILTIQNVFFYFEIFTLSEESAKHETWVHTHTHTPISISICTSYTHTHTHTHTHIYIYIYIYI